MTTRANERSRAAEAELALPARKVRADSQRNRQRLIEAAKVAFAELGPDVSLDVIARRAGVGIGTVYRHFPTRDVLIGAVCRREVENLAAAASQLLATEAPAEALNQWMRLTVDYIGTKKLMAAAVSFIFGLGPDLYRNSASQITENPVFGVDTELYRTGTTLITEAMTLLVDRATAAGEIRPGVQPLDLLRAVAGFTVTYGDDVEGWEASALRLVEILMDGLRAHR